MSILSAFNTQLVNLFDEMCQTFPDDKEIKMATEAVKGAKKINPRLILDLFLEHVYKDCGTAIYERNAPLFRQIAQHKISTQFNEMISALSIFRFCMVCRVCLLFSFLMGNTHGNRCSHDDHKRSDCTKQYRDKKGRQTSHYTGDQSQKE